MATNSASPNLQYVVTFSGPTGKADKVYPIGFTPIIPRIGEKLSGKDGDMEVTDVIHELGTVDGSDILVARITLKLKIL
ncbi:MAG: hypothetical protein M5R41_06355 [Bacteroidia bacterium]|nr:hypothetical protein [Bacteroidia bacterium]